MPPETRRGLHARLAPYPPRGTTFTDATDAPSTSAMPMQCNEQPALAPPTTDFLTIPNPLSHTNFPGHRGAYISEAASSVGPGTVNVVAHDQFNLNFNINMNTAEHAVGVGIDVERNAENFLLDPLFDKLSHVVKSSYDASTPALRRACTENTRTAIIGAIVDWAFDPSIPNIYWMNGMAGTGKTTISYSLCIALKRYNILMATFFCSRLVDECTKVDRIFPTIAYNLARNYPPLASAILDVLKRDPDIANRTLRQQFTELLVKPSKIAAERLQGKPVVLVIDALDECTNQVEVQALLSIIFQRSFELPFKIFITSRPEQVLRVGFNRQNPDRYSKLILHDIERDIVNADIKLYLTERLVDMVDGRSDFQEPEDNWPPEEKVDALTRQASGLFIFAKTVCDYIGEHGGNVLENLDAAILLRKDSDELSCDRLDTSELDRLYRNILDRAIPSRPKARNRLRQILSAIVNIRDPLSAHGLGTILEIEPEVIRSALGSLHSILSVPQSPHDPVSTFHASFPDFISDPNRSQHHFLSSAESHHFLAERCLSLMNASLKENICGLQGRPANETIPSETISAHIPEGLAYACIYWASHFSTTRKEETWTGYVCKLLYEFLRDHVLHWMECLSLLGRLDVAIEYLRTMEGWSFDIFRETSPMITDARRFITENFELIRYYCLETYYSALVWLPLQSIIRKRHATRRHDLPKVIAGLRNAWGPCEKAIVCKGVCSVALSVDGKHIVSGSNKNVVVWNAITGESEAVLEGHSKWVESVAFSSNGNHIVSGSSDNTIRIWNAVTGESERTLEGHISWVRSVAFSGSGSHVASGSSDNTVRVWNAFTGELEHILEGHSSSVNSVAFSNDGNRIVSGSYDKTVRIWSVVSGESERILVGHSDCVMSVVFSIDGSLVVSGSWDKTIRIWDLVTESERILDGDSSIMSVAFSSDSRHVVSGSGDSMVRVWNAVTGESERILEGHSSYVSSVAFSHDGSHVVSGSEDLTIRIWNLLTDSEGSLEGHSDKISSVAFSKDGSRVVSGARDGTILIWNAVTGESDELDGHRDSVLCTSFSSDGSHVVSGSRDETVSIWNVLTGELEQLFKGHELSVWSVAFSSDGNYVVSGSGDGIVRVWNTVVDEPETIFEGHSARVACVTFSSDSTCIVSGSWDNTARIWNAVTGESGCVLRHPSWVMSVAFSSDGSHVISGSSDKSVRIWNTVTGEAERILEPSVVFSSDSARIVAKSDETETAIRISDAITRKHTCLPFVRLSDQTQVQYEPGGRFNITTATSEHPTFHPLASCFLSDDMAWIYTDSDQRRCWIPQHYRIGDLDDIVYYSCGLKIAFRFSLGNVVIIDLQGL